MTELRRDPIVGRWIVVDLDENIDIDKFKSLVPQRVVSDLNKCFFCPGKEHETPPEVYVKKGGSGVWDVRVVPNKFPALMIEGDLSPAPVGFFDTMNGVGAHEVVIETPDHYASLGELSYEHVQEVLLAVGLRMNDLAKDKRLKYILAFKNHRSEAGASIDHSHSQLIAMPMVPKNVKEEMDGAFDYYKLRNRCIFCDIIAQEMSDSARVIYQNEGFLTICPFASRFPFEMWILPKDHIYDYRQLDGTALMLLAKALKDALMRLKVLLNDPPYNFIVHTAPVAPPLTGGGYEHYHLHIEIMPRLTPVAGFEWGTGFYYCPIKPDISAKHLYSVVW